MKHFSAFVSAILIAFLLIPVESQALTITVEDPNVAPADPVANYRWLIETDTTHPVTPGVSDPGSLSFSIHNSATTVMCTGATISPTIEVDGAGDPCQGRLSVGGRYFVSVLPNHDIAGEAPRYTLGGTGFTFNGNPQAVTVAVSPAPVPTAQITVFVFEDMKSINNAPDMPGETGLGPGATLIDGSTVPLDQQFTVQLFDTADKQLQDIFGNPLGTDYKQAPCNAGAGETESSTGFCEADGGPVITVAGSGLILTGSCVPPNDQDCGVAKIKYLSPGKYGVKVVPPAGEGWQQTSTIEGTPLVDAWVKGNEPPFFVEFGPAGYHVFIGFVKDAVNIIPIGGTSTVTGTIVNLHNSRPPEFSFEESQAIAGCFVGLNNAPVDGVGIFVTACDDDSNFTIPNLAPGDYQMVIWDKFLDVIFALQNFRVNDGSVAALPAGSCDGKVDNLGAIIEPPVAGCDYGNIPVFAWFGRIENFVFFDTDQDGYPDEGEVGMPEQNINLRFKDGSIRAAFPTDLAGYVPFDEVFPFFQWLVAEVDFARYKATGMTAIVDAGGVIPPNVDSITSTMTTNPDFLSWVGTLNPQRNCTPNLDPGDATADANGVYGDCIDVNNPNLGAGDKTLARTETGEVLTQAYQSFLGQTHAIFWGKNLYGPGDEDRFPYGNFPSAEDVDNENIGSFDPGNGGVSGVVILSTTRAEDDPRFAAGEEWEPGIARVQVALYADGDVDNAPHTWRPVDPLSETEVVVKGPEDIDWNNDGVFQGPNGVIQDLDGISTALGNPVTLADVDNYPFGNFPAIEDVDRNYPGQIPGAFDAGDALQIGSTDSWDDNRPTGCPPNPTQLGAGTQAPFYIHGDPLVPAEDCFEGMRTFGQIRNGTFDGGYAFASHHPHGIESGNPEVDGLPNATYIVEAVTPPGYETLKEEDKNVDFGDSYTPSPLLLPPFCVGDDHVVPASLSLFPYVDAPFAGETRPLCDRKQVVLAAGQNGAADMFMLTEVPRAARIVGFVLDDLSNEFDPNSPTFGEKYSPPWLPISANDFNGNEMTRGYSDEFGAYSLLVPSTYTVAVPNPAGVAPGMVTTCVNDPGPIKNPDFGGPGEPEFIIDPFFNKQYSQFCYTFDFWPGKMTRLDTPVLALAAFAGPEIFPLDCEFPDGTPAIYSASGPQGGPYVDAAGIGQTITLVSLGPTDVLNPEFDQQAGTPKTISRDFGFGASKGGGSVTVNGVPLDIEMWSDGAIEAKVQGGITSGQLMVTRDNGMTTNMGVTLHVCGPAPIHVPPGGSIQTVIDLATANGDTGELIMVPPGKYEELVILPEQMKLQGWGAHSTIISARKLPAEKLIDWRNRVSDLVTTGNGNAYLLTGQEAGDPGALEPDLFNTEEGAGITVLAKDASVAPDPAVFTSSDPARVDGFTVTGSDGSGGIFVNGHANFLQITNNLVVNNQGFYHGGIRIGHPVLPDETNLATGGIADGDNNNITIAYNQVTQNGALNGAGGGISLCTGTDNYLVKSNNICGNFTSGHGAGIGHLGLSDGGRIEHNSILFNESFRQGRQANGGGLYIAGVNSTVDPYTAGAGDVTVDSNLFQGNLAGAGDGGAIAAIRINGQDVLDNPVTPSAWHKLDIFNNMIVNNVAGLAGGGIALQDAVNATIVNNTIANNDSTATAGAAFAPGVPNTSSPQQGAGIISRAHSDTSAGSLIAPLTGKTFSDPVLVNNIVWHNRSFFYNLIADGNPTPCPGTETFCIVEATPLYEDLAATGGLLSPMYSLLTDRTGYSPTNLDEATDGADPMFVAEYFNAGQSSLVLPEVNTGIAGVPAFDEGGNFIDLAFGPLTTHDPGTGDLFGDYHLGDGSSALDTGDNGVLGVSGDLSEDIDNDPRPDGTADIGADESPADINILGGLDSDADGIGDSLDNCVLLANASQLDSNGDGIGNLCDPDLDNDGNVNFNDLGILSAAFFSNAGSANWNADADLDGDGNVNFNDLGIMGSFFFSVPGPSGIAP